MNLKNYTQRPRWYKVIKEGSDYYNQVHEVKWIYLEDKKVKFRYLACDYPLDDVQEVVPTYINGEWQPMKLGDEYVCVGDTYEDDEYEDREIYDYNWYNGGITIENTKDWQTNCRSSFSLEPEDYTPLHPLNTPPQLNSSNELTDDEMVEELKKRGVITNGKIIK